MSSSNGSTPRNPRPVAVVRRHGALIAASGSLLVGLLVLTGIALDGSRAAGQTPRAAAVDVAEVNDPSAPPVATDVIGERAAELYVFLETVAENNRRADAEAAAQAAARAPRRAANIVSPDDPNVWDHLAQCETGGNWATDSVPGFAGGLGFANGTWNSYGGGEFAGSAADASRAQQIEIATRVLDGQGWGAWPGCSSLLGLR